MKVTDLTIEEFRALVRSTIEEVLSEHLDESELPLRSEFVEELGKALTEDLPATPADEIARRLGLAW